MPCWAPCRAWPCTHQMTRTRPATTLTLSRCGTSLGPQQQCSWGILLVLLTKWVAKELRSLACYAHRVQPVRGPTAVLAWNCVHMLTCNSHLFRLPLSATLPPAAPQTPLPVLRTALTGEDTATCIGPGIHHSDCGVS